jgi:Replication-relaxation
VMVRQTPASDELDVKRLRLGRSAARALRLLEICPMVPIDAFAGLMGLSSVGGAYKQLGKLRSAGLADRLQGDVGYLVSERPLALWRITEQGRRAMKTADVDLVGDHRASHHAVDRMHPKLHRQHTQLTLLVAAYRLLSAMLVERAGIGRPVDVWRWEYPWIRSYRSVERGRVLTVKIPGGALLCPRPKSGVSLKWSVNASHVLLLPDLGTAPVSRYRETLRRLARWDMLLDGLGDLESELVIATVDPDGRGTRRTAWLQLLERVGLLHEGTALRARLLSWIDLVGMTGQNKLPAHTGGSRDVGAPDYAKGTVPFVRHAPGRGRHQVLHLIGRHPFLTIRQLSDLLGTTSRRIRRLEEDLVAGGWLRRIAEEEVPDRASCVARSDWDSLGLVEITSAGRLRLAAFLGLDVMTATRYHGFIGSVRSQTGRRRRLLRTLAHTLGANAVFVAFAVAADSVRRAGGTDQLLEWRSAAACERRNCKPDGYGYYVRDGVAYGFFLEYDHGTESFRKYAAKFRAYYWYRDSGQAGRDFDGFPTLLFVTTDPLAEDRIAEQAYRAWFLRSTEPLPVLITTTNRVTDNGEGILGPIWRTPAAAESSPSPDRQYWLPTGSPRSLYGTRKSLKTPRLVWPVQAVAHNSAVRGSRCTWEEERSVGGHGC